MAKNTTVTFNPFGCLPLVISIAALWALCFGVTIDGKHYGSGCSCDKGVMIESGRGK